MAQTGVEMNNGAASLRPPEECARLRESGARAAVLDDPAWRAPSARPALGQDEVHVWRIPLEAPLPSRVARLERLLDAPERQRALRYRFPEDRRRFIITRGVLRLLLGAYLGADPGALTFRYGRHGKPALAGPPRASALRFNVAHSHELALIAVAQRRALGVDLEYLRPIDHEKLAARVLGPRERAAFDALPEQARRRAFFDAWTRKEAFLKATGHGLSRPLRRLDLAPVTGGLQIIRAGARGWALRELHPDPGYTGALAVQGQDWRLACWRWSWRMSGTGS
ncbi:MAG: 4'-phosphopantetheinyl transferase superfamily protein [Gammaproteobacteria bacterium]|nr:4'-phosphopantetheinyl transferase superfamily protein [Gammaproteobacteria bacterium]